MITHRIETGIYVIIGFKMNKIKNPQRPPIQVGVTFKRKGKLWMATQELYDDPVFFYWKEPNKIVPKIVRQLEWIR